MGMDDLKNYLKTLEDDVARAEFAKRCGTSLGYMRLVSYGFKVASPKLAMLIERESQRQVKAEQVCRECADLFTYMRQTCV